jgi:hypothetical protein
MRTLNCVVVSSSPVMEFSGIAWHNVTEHLFLGELAGTMLF